MSAQRSRQLIEAWRPITLNELVPRHVRATRAGVLTLQFDNGQSIQYIVDELLCGFDQLFLGARQVRIPLLRCPKCHARRRILYASTTGLGCRGCFKLRYQSQLETWDLPTAEAIDKRLQEAASRPGPRGGRYRIWERRAIRARTLGVLQVESWCRRQARLFARFERRRFGRRRSDLCSK